jgi:hypothetical protein
MFVPVACLKCGKMFQVPEAAAGAEVACPWCRAATTALPIAGTLASPVTETPAPHAPTPPHELLSLDDAEPAPELPRVIPEPLPRAIPVPPWPPARFSLRPLLVGLAIVVVGSAATLAVLRYGSGHISPASWAEFTPPDGSCSFALPGTPTAESLEPTDGVAGGGERYVTTGWYSRATVWVGWRTLDPAWAKQAQADRDGALTAPVLAAERDRRKEQAGGTVTREAKVRYAAYSGSRVEMDTPRGQLVEFYIVVPDGPRPRLYFLGIEAKHVAPDGPAATRLFGSFKLTDR